MKKMKGSPQARRLKPKRLALPLAGMGIAGVWILMILACNLPVTGRPSSAITPVSDVPRTSSPPVSSNQSQSSQAGDLDKAMPIDTALAILPEDNRPQLLQEMGQPDIFEIDFAQIHGKPVREEKWSYFRDNVRFDFVDGSLLYTETLQAVPDFSINASVYDPMDFKPGMSHADVQQVLSGQTLTPMDLADYGAPAGQLYFGSQILLGFDNGQLVYVRTFELSPEGGS